MCEHKKYARHPLLRTSEFCASSPNLGGTNTLPVLHVGFSLGQIRAGQERLRSLGRHSTLMSSDKKDDVPGNAQDLTMFVQGLLDQMQGRFNQMSEQIITKIDEMGTRIDDLERSIGDLMTQAGVDGPEQDLTGQPSKPEIGDGK